MFSDDAERIARLERQIAFLYRHLGLDPDGPDVRAYAGPGAAPFSGPASAPGAFGEPADAVPAAQAAAPPGFTPAVRDAMARGNLIQAIKLYRENTGVGLAEAKAAVEGMARNR